VSRDFDGSSGYLSRSPGTPLSTTGAWTVAAWVNLDVQPANYTALFSHAYAGGAIPTILGIAGGGDGGVAGRWRAGFYAPGWQGAGDVSVPTLGAWQHIAGTCRGGGVATPGQLKLYRQGALIATTSPGSAYAGTTLDWYIARRWDNPDMINGKIAEAAVWMNKDVADVGPVLSDAEIAALARGVHPTYFRRNYLKQYIPILGLASPEADWSGNGLNMTVNGTAPAIAMGPPVGRMAA